MKVYHLFPIDSIESTLDTILAEIEISNCTLLIF